MDAKIQGKRVQICEKTLFSPERIKNHTETQNELKRMKATGKYLYQDKLTKSPSVQSSKRRHVTGLQISWPWRLNKEAIRDTLLGLIVFRTYGTLCHHPAVNSLAFVSLCHNLRKKIVAYLPLLIDCISSYNLPHNCEGTGLYINFPSPLLIT